MAKALQDWVEQDVLPVKGEPLRWLAERFFFRDPVRPMYSDATTFFSPADGIVLYAMTVVPDAPLVEP